MNSWYEQDEDGNITIYADNGEIYHVKADHPMSDEQLAKYCEFYILMKEQEANL